MPNVYRDQNRVTGLLAESTDNDGVVVPLQADPTTHRLKVESSISSGLGKLVTEDFNSITATYPTDTTEVYTYKLSTTTVATITVTYTDNTKAVLSTVVRT